MIRKKNRCYGARYGGRYRNFALPARRSGETWAEYHDRLSGMAAIAADRGHKAVARALETRAGQIASQHPGVRRRPRTRPKQGPGTYPWSQCVKDARARGSSDPKAVCGAIRAKSRKKYPAYWKARHGKKRNPGREETARAAYNNMEAAALSVAEALSASSAKRRMEWIVSASMYAGAALADAGATGDTGLRHEAASLAGQIRDLAAEMPTWSPTKTARNKRQPPKRAKNRTNKRAVLASFMRGT